MDLIKLIIKGISFSQTQTGAYALILEEELGNKKLPIIIGSFEAQSIALALEKDIQTPRPITHDLMADFARTFNIKIKYVFIHKLEDGVFFSNLICEGPNGEEKTLDSRTSDAIALALRFNSPIYTSENVMEKAGIFLDVDAQNESNTQFDNKEIENFNIETNPKSNTDHSVDSERFTEEELNKKLDEAVKNEDYEAAAKLRDQLNKLK